ncbi:Fe-S cluster assembly sulfur transfer protein SufU [[Mycoplasma] gypis]|uniref:SUF system NifU family Fe-S cluster assembly protein n=1 Tax=[Mycoplasma] gypis TaxID=92404 RepID=A0ABZ2RSN9_9BACT|nr:SUF system NifU family Fe-S cluster assembly protein [[Mycoplasma] gypis]MBN0919164.1 SUF system NifU family Fe-S cluster assembly protein [[Mycoplasma] gypis]
MTSYSNDQKREIIYSHYLEPKFKSDKNLPLKAFAYSRSGCADNLELSVEIKDNKVVDANFIGEGCSIFVASTDIMLETIVGKSLDEVKEIILNFQKMINKEDHDKKNLEKLVVFENVKTHMNRVECASLIIRTIEEVIHNEK